MIITLTHSDPLTVSPIQGRRHSSVVCFNSKALEQPMHRSHVHCGGDFCKWCFWWFECPSEKYVCFCLSHRFLLNDAKMLQRLYFSQTSTWSYKLPIKLLHAACQCMQSTCEERSSLCFSDWLKHVCGSTSGSSISFMFLRLVYEPALQKPSGTLKTCFK